MKINEMTGSMTDGTRVSSTVTEHVKALEARVEILERENARLRQVIETFCDVRDLRLSTEAYLDYLREQKR